MFWIILLNWGKCILHHHFMVIIWNPQDPSHVLQYLVEFYCLHIGSCETFWKDSCALYFKPNPQKWGFTRFQWGQTRWIKLPHLCSAVEIKKKTALCLRVTYAFRLFQSGGNEKLMRELTGHVSNALFKYEKVSEDQVKRVSKILSSDQRSISNSKEKMNVNDKAKEKRVER